MQSKAAYGPARGWIQSNRISLLRCAVSASVVLRRARSIATGPRSFEAFRRS